MSPTEIADAARALLARREPRSADDLAAALAVDLPTLIRAIGAVGSGLERCAPTEPPKAWWWRRTFHAANEMGLRRRRGGALT